MLGINRGSGEKISSLDEHIRQSIADILTTPISSRVIRREYGSLLPELIDQPLNEKNILRLYAATAAAVMRWEPRFKISKILLTRQNGQVIVELKGSVGDSNESINVGL
jgi:phage baseplate assembly protein W